MVAASVRLHPSCTHGTTISGLNTAKAAGSLLARLSYPERAYCRLAEKLAILELGEQLPGFGRRGSLSEHE